MQCAQAKWYHENVYKESVYGYLCDLHVFKWNNSDGYICWKCVLSNCSVSCVSCVIDSIGLPYNAMCTSKMIPRKWHIYNRFELITFITYIHSKGFSLLNTIKLHTQFAINNMILPIFVGSVYLAIVVYLVFLV
jgi:hypothetical protein